MGTVWKILQFILKIPDMLNIFKHAAKWWKNWKARRHKKRVDHAFKKAKDKKNTKDLQDEIGKYLH